MEAKMEAQRLVRRIIPAAIGGVLLSAAAFVGGCNTTAGIGEDIEAAGEAINDAAEAAKD